MEPAPTDLCGPQVDALLARISEKLASRAVVRIDDPTLTPAAVVLPLTLRDDCVNVLFTKRADTVEHHKNEISFPGGRVDKADADHLAAALRETWEEIGIPAQCLAVLGEMDDFISISGYRVRPYVVYLREGAPPFEPQPGEVSEIIEVPLPHLLDPANHRYDTPFSRANPVHFYHWNDKIIWGLTGGILYNFLKITFDGEGENWRW